MSANRRHLAGFDRIQPRLAKTLDRKPELWEFVHPVVAAVLRRDVENA